MPQLFSDDEDSVKGGETQLTINEHYAKAFEYRKEREELERLKAKYGSDYDPDASGSDFSTDSESAESEDEHGEELTPAVDAAILRTLARIKKRDPAIYDSQKDIFGEEHEKIGTSSTSQAKGKTKSKPVTLRQVNMDAMLQGSRSPSPENEPHPLTHVEEQEALRRETIAAFHSAAEKVDEDDILVPREKTKDEREREEEEYRAFLEREVGDLKELVTVETNEDDEVSFVKEDEGEGDVDQEDTTTEKKKKKKKKKKSKATAEGGSEPVKKSKAEQDQEFLVNYILNRGWIDRSEGHVPTYNEITSPAQERRKKKGKSKAEPQEGDDDLPKADGGDDDDEEMDTGMLSDTSFESLASHFETSYNHRFEEPGASTIPSFPRTLTSVVRRQDTTRKDARERRKQRKEEELQKKREEVKRLKALKMREIKRKLELIGKQGGLKKAKSGEDDVEDEFVDEALRELDLEGEWDPEKHDRQMADLFDRGEDAFEEEVGFGGDDDDDDAVRYDANGKPIWDDDVDIGDIPISDDDAHIVYDPNPKLSKKEKKKKKKKKDAAGDDGVDVDAMDADALPQFDDEEEWDGTEEMRKRKFNEYMDQIYGLDFNDLVGDLPTRFNYVPVQPQNYALTPAEILMATDQELNEYMSVKKYAPYREDKANRNRWNPKSQEKLHEIKAKVGERLGTTFASSTSRRSAPHGGEEGEKPKKRKGKKERMKLKAALGTNGEGVEGGGVGEDAPQSGAAQPRSNGSTERAKKRKREEEQTEVDEERSRKSEDPTGDANESTSKKKRKRRHRRKEDEE
ncbi:hypothetical protein BDN70DRAFT_998692 [Pholiota conissans]|uniref:Kri1-like C-terminal domain-containing protein n=1 Tax=Pholiota conissans TaxID=109636 RepID=A0A9P6CT55_9AGAR|nr:hypothetical protein BDN70DRAFT_998692 [Pholiota conissans]